MNEEVTALDKLLGGLVAEAAPQLITMFGIGVDTAGQLLITVGDNPGRVHSEAAFAMLCGVAPGGVSFSVCAVRCCWFERR